MQVDESDYVGRDVDEVEDELKDLGLKVRKDEQDNPGDEEEDSVEGVDPSGTLEEGDTVTVTYWGPPPTEEQPSTSDRTARPGEAAVNGHLVGGRYELGELLGRGGMAEVRKGTDIRLGRIVAVKRLRTDLASDATFQARFRREAQSSASLNHPAIVAVYDTGEEMATDGSGVAQPYIVMEYVAGRTLRDILREGRKILPERALEITSGVLAALDYSHRAGIIHRDIKPGNVMLTPSGDVKVMDFGIARAISRRLLDDDPDRGRRRHRAVPLPRAGARRDRRLPLRRLLHRLPALRAAHRPAAVRRRQPGRGGLPARARAGACRRRDHDTELPPEIDAIVMKALAKRVEDRYQCAAAMRSDIERYLAGRPVQAPSYPRRRRRPTIRRPPPRRPPVPPPCRTRTRTTRAAGRCSTSCSACSCSRLIAAGAYLLPSAVRVAARAGPGARPDRHDRGRRRARRSATPASRSAT